VALSIQTTVTYWTFTPFGVEGAYLLSAPFSVGGLVAVWGPLGPARLTRWLQFLSDFCVTFPPFDMGFSYWVSSV
jgi:hypothetical protein